MTTRTATTKPQLPEGWTIALEKNQYFGLHKATGRKTLRYVEKHEAITAAAEMEKNADMLGLPPTRGHANGHHAEEFKHLPLDAIIAHPQIRRYFDEAKLNELAQSIREKGVIEPVIVRRVHSENPHLKGDERYCIVAGERRWRASKLAGQATIPAIIRDLDDKAALEIQVTENVQRADLHPIEEANGFEALREKCDYSVADIAAKIGRPEKYVYHRLRLLDLPEATQEALWSGKIKLSQALVIAKLLENPKDQAEVTKEILKKDRWRDLETEARLTEYIQREYLTLLSSAAFSTKDANLVPRAGACTACTKRTGAQSLLFEEEFKKKDTCLDRACFQAKQKAFVEIEIDKAKEAGVKVLSKTETEKLFPYSSSSSLGWEAEKTYARLDDKVSADSKKRTYGQLLGKEAEVILAVRDNQLVKLVEKKTAHPAIAKKYESVTFSSAATSGRSDDERKRMAEEKRKKLARQTVFSNLLHKIAAFWEAEEDPVAQDQLVYVLVQMAAKNCGSDAQRNFCKALSLEVPTVKRYGADCKDYEGAIQDALDGWSEHQRWALLFQLVVADSLDFWASGGSTYRDEQRLALGKVIGFDFGAEMKAAMDLHKPKPKGKAQKPNPKNETK